jgi:hypothetical protein
MRKACEHARPAVARTVDEHEAAATRARDRTLGHPGGERGRHAGVDGVSARGERPRARLGGQGVACGDRSGHVVTLS